MLKYRNDHRICIEKAADLLDDDTGKVVEMTIDEWLHRLNLFHLKKFFDKAKIRRSD